MIEESAGLRQQRGKQAIELAMEGRWREAVLANQEIISSFPSDVSAYNRLGRAYMELGEFASARDAYEKAIKIDPYNTIAQKNLSRLTGLEETSVDADDAPYARPQYFIEEPGKAGLVELCCLGEPMALAKLAAGDQVHLKVDKAGLTVENSHGHYLGMVGSKDGPRLIRLIEGGNRYAAAVVRASPENVTVIIREVYQDPSQLNRPSFPLKGFKSPRAYVSEKIKHELESEEGDEEPGYNMMATEEIEIPEAGSADYDHRDNEE